MKRNLQSIRLLLCLAFPVIGLAAPCPEPANDAFTGCYYSNITLSGEPLFIRTDRQIDFYWGNQSPDRTLTPLDFSVRWQGNFTFSSGTYTFTTIISDGVRLYVDGNLIIDSWRVQPSFSYVVTRALSQGTHLVTVEYFERLGGAIAQVSWQNTSPTTPAAPVISSFAATPSSVPAGQPVALSWSVSGAASVSLDNGIGDVTNRSTVTVWPSQTTVYTLTASGSTDVAAATVKVVVQAGGAPVDSQPPTTPSLTSAAGAAQVDLVWNASADNVGIAGYQILRNASVVGSVPGATLSYSDTSVSLGSVYLYAVKAYDAAGNYSAASNAIQVTTAAIAPSPTTCPAPATGAFTGCYYSNITLSGSPAFIRTDRQIDFYWGNQSPDSSLTPLDFSVRWQGNFMFSSGTYTFTTIISDGVRLYIDGNLIIDSWRVQPSFSYVVTRALSQGTHLVTVEYFERLGGAIAQVSWQNTSPTTPAAPVISSFAATPSSVPAGQPVALSWSVSGAASVSLDNGIGDVTNRSTVTVWPSQTTVYTLTASGSTDVAAATVKVVVQAGGAPVDSQPPTTPSLTSAAAGAAQVDLVWNASADNVGIAGYQIPRNASVVGSVPGATLSYSDTSVSLGSVYLYAVKAYDAAGNYSAASNAIQVTTAAIATNVSVNWHGGCWQPLTLGGITGNFQAVDFALTTSAPVAIQGTLFFAANCDPSQGTDNMNDFNTLTPSIHMIQGFSHFPDVIPTSAYYWAGPRTGDGKCAPGAPCSGCINYNKATPLCSSLP